MSPVRLQRRHNARVTGCQSRLPSTDGGGGCYSDHGKQELAAVARSTTLVAVEGVTLVAPSTAVAWHDGLDAQGFSRRPPLSCFVAGVKPAFMVRFFPNILIQEGFKEWLPPGTGYAFCFVLSCSPTLGPVRREDQNRSHRCHIRIPAIKVTRARSVRDTGQVLSAASRSRRIRCRSASRRHQMSSSSAAWARLSSRWTDGL